MYLPAFARLGTLFWLCASLGPHSPAQTIGGCASVDAESLERLALARARTELGDRVAQLPLTADLTIGVWAAWNLERERALRLWLRTLPSHNGPHAYADGTCDVDVRLFPDVLASRLVALVRRHPSEQDSQLTAGDITRAARDWPVLWSTGTSETVAHTAVAKPEGWEDIQSAGIELARRAATADALHALLDRAGQLKLTPAHRVREFLDADDAVFDATYAAVADAATVEVETAADQIAVARARVGMTDLIRILTTVHERNYRGNLFHAPDFHEMALEARGTEVYAEGFATPPIRYRERAPREPIGLEVPEWTNEMRTATGCYTAAAGEGLPWETRVELARCDALPELRARLEALAVREGLSVRQVLDRRRELRTDFAIFLDGARVTDWPPVDCDGTITVIVELPLGRLWKIVRRGLIQQADADASASGPPGVTPERKERP